MKIIANLLKNNENHRKSIKTAIQKPDFLRRNEKNNENRALERFSYMFREGGWNPIFRMKNNKIIEKQWKSWKIIENQ